VLGLRRALGCPSLFTQPPHITLVPPVNVRIEDIDQVLESTRLICARTNALRLKLGPIATFSPVTPVLYLSVGGDDVEKVTALREAALTGPLLRKTAYEYIPHCTLHEDASIELIQTGMIALAEYRRVIDIRSLEILRQEEDRVWRTLAAFPLGPPVVRGRGSVEVSFRRSSTVPPQAMALLHAGHEARHGQAWCIDARSEDGSVIGVASGILHQTICVVKSFTVDEAHRRLGLGDHLLTEVLLYAESTSAESIRIDGSLSGVDSERWVRDWLARRSFSIESFTCMYRPLTRPN
jgi:2'-5' RNA ligase